MDTTPTARIEDFKVKKRGTNRTPTEKAFADKTWKKVRRKKRLQKNSRKANR